MFNTIRTCEANKLRITELTNKLQLGAENVIARLAFGYSLGKGNKLELSDIQDSKGKEYSARVLFGEYLPFYIAMICQNYGIYKTDRNIPRYIKLHIDNGLEKIAEQTNKKGIDFVLDEVEEGVTGQTNIY